MEAVASAHWWASLASASSCSPEVSCLSLWEAASQWWDRWALAGSSPPFPSNSHLSSAVDGPSQKTRCPLLPPALVQAHMVGSGSLFQHIHLMEELPNFFSGGPVSHKLDGRCICPGVQPWEIIPVTVANQPFCFLPPWFSGMNKHPLKDEQVVWSPDIQPQVFIQEQLCIYVVFCLSNGQPFFLCPVFGDQGLVPFVLILQFQ